MATTSQADWAKITKQEKEARQKAKNTRQTINAAKTEDKKVLALQQQANTIYTVRIKPAELEITNLEIQNVPLIRAYNDYVTAHKNDPGYPTPTNTAALSLLSQPVDYNFGLINGYKKRIDDANKELANIQTQINKIRKVYTSNPNVQGKGSKGSTNSGAPQGQKIQFSKDHKYNAPMVSEAYFGTQSFTNTVLDGKFVDQGKYGDAREAWKGVTGGRGTIQMDQRFLSTFTTNSFDKAKVKFDLQKYGFKFLYNPTTVSMAWGLMSSMDPFYEAQQMDKFQVVASSLMSSTVSFQLMLNRIKDFDYIDSTGLRSGAIPQYVNTSTLAGIQAASTLKNNPYPETVPNEDLAEIYNKGTMYDLEYLFKTINGPDGTFVSDLNGTTADRGWMRPTIVELHLGNSMRYRVRVSEFAVNHLMFNNRMVPLLSTVTLTCSRFVDGPTTPRTDSNGASRTTSGAVTWSSSPGPSELRAAGYNR